MKTTILFLFIILIVGCSSPSSYEDIKVIEYKYGICESNKVISMDSKESPSGIYGISSDLKLKKQCDTIPAEVGIKFGVMYEVSSKINQELFVDKVWTFPQEITNDKGKTFSEITVRSEVKTNKKFYTVYFFEKPYEVKKGEWKFEIFHEGKKLYEKKFFVR